jgi:hypothetical protein
VGARSGSQRLVGLGRRPPAGSAPLMADARRRGVVSSD